MKLEKAIKVGERYVKNPCPVITPDELASFKLGIEAMKRHHELRVMDIDFTEKLLPGETEE